MEQFDINVISDCKNLSSHQKTEFKHKYEHEHGNHR